MVPKKKEKPIKDILIRAVKTFWQALAASLALLIANNVSTEGLGGFAEPDNLVAIAVGALAAGLSALQNSIKAKRANN